MEMISTRDLQSLRMPELIFFFAHFWLANFTNFTAKSLASEPISTKNTQIIINLYAVMIGRRWQRSKIVQSSRGKGMKVGPSHLMETGPRYTDKVFQLLIGYQQEVSLDIFLCIPDLLEKLQDHIMWKS